MGKIITFGGKSITFTLSWPLNTLSNLQKKNLWQQQEGGSMHTKELFESFKIKGSPVRAFDVNKFIGCEILQAGIHYDKPRCWVLL